MSIEDWLRWPTKSTDPAANAAIAVVLALVVVFALVVGATILIPVAIVIGIAKGVQWYVNRPVPTDQLYAQTEQRVIAANFPDAEAFMDAHLDRLLDAIRDDLPTYAIFRTMADLTKAIYKKENLNNPLPPLAITSEIEEGRYRDDLIAQQRKSVDAPRTLEVFNATLGKAYLDFLAGLPPIAKTTPDQFSKCDDIEAFATFPLIDVLPEVGKAVSSLISPFFADDVEQIGLFVGLRRQLDRNFRDVSAEAPGAKLITPDKHKGTPRQIVTAYLNNTPFEALFYAPVPFSLSDEQRFEHTHVVGGSGHGKTQLLQHLIVTDLRRDKPPALIIVDSQGEMLEKIQKLNLFAAGRALADRLIIIDPEDTQYSPALNMFDIKTARTGAPAEQLEATTISLFNYIFSSIAAELTSRQNTTFSYVTRLMLSIDGATIHTLLELFEDGAKTVDSSPFVGAIQALDPTSQSWFRNQFFTNAYSPTKQSVARRLYSVLQVPAFKRMFASKTNKLDMFDAMQSGKIILVNTSRLLLQDDASRLFGRYFIALALKAAYDRVAVPEQQRHPAFLIVDEAAEYFDDNIEELLSTKPASRNSASWSPTKAYNRKT